MVDANPIKSTVVARNLLSSRYRTGRSVSTKWANFTSLSDVDATRIRDILAQRSEIYKYLDK